MSDNPVLHIGSSKAAITFWSTDAPDRERRVQELIDLLDRCSIVHSVELGISARARVWIIIELSSVEQLAMLRLAGVEVKWLP